MGLKAVGIGMAFPFKEAVMKIYKLGAIQAGAVMTQASFQVNSAPVGQYVRNSDLDFYAVQDGTFFIVITNASLSLNTQVAHFSSGDLIHTMQSSGEGILILAL